MELQFKILSDFREKYPDLTLKQISKLTGIQITRVFRLFNGSEMKLKEYEMFQNTLKQEGDEEDNRFGFFEGLRNKEKEDLLDFSSVLERWSTYRSINTI